MMIETNGDISEEIPDFNFSNRDLERIQRGRNVMLRSEQVIGMD